jgi:predicted nucleic acid-binding protein
VTPDLTVDASVSIAASDTTDVSHEASRAFFDAVEDRDVRLIVPALAMVEVACALARKHRDAELGRRLAQSLLPPDQVVQVPLNDLVLSMAQQVGTDAFLRSADALYAATASLTGSTLISWDRELIQRAGAVSPTDWLDANA